MIDSAAKCSQGYHYKHTRNETTSLWKLNKADNQNSSHILGIMAGDLTEPLHMGGYIVSVRGSESQPIVGPSNGQR